jgi:hypothetical protein
LGWGIVLANVVVLGLGSTTMFVGTLAATIRFGHNVGWFVDWQTYANAAARALDGREIYAPEQITGAAYHLNDTNLIGFAYPPIAALAFVPFASYPVGLIVWTILIVGTFLTALWALASRAWPRRRALLYGVILLLLGITPPFVEAVAVGNVVLLLAGLIGWAWLVPRLAHIILAIALPTKAPMIFLAGWIARSAGWRPTARMMMGLAALSALTLPLVGIGAWFDYITAMRTATPICTPWNVSVACETQLGTLGGIAMAAALAIASYAVRRPTLGFALAVLAVLVATPDLHTHSWLVLVPVGLVLAARGLTSRAREPIGELRQDVQVAGCTDLSERHREVQRP